MAPKQDPKPKFQEGNDLSVLISDRSLPPVRLEAAANVGMAASPFTVALPPSNVRLYWGVNPARQSFSMSAFYQLLLGFFLTIAQYPPSLHAMYQLSIPSDAKYCRNKTNRSLLQPPFPTLSSHSFSFACLPVCLSNRVLPGSADS